MNQYPAWKYGLIIVVLLFGVVFALPNIYSKDPALQVSALRGGSVGEVTRLQVEADLEVAEVEVKSWALGTKRLIVRFNNETDQLRAREALQDSLGDDYIVALNLSATVPSWLDKFGAQPMFLGLDLRGGVHFLMEVDMATAIVNSENRLISDIRTLLKAEKVRYKTITRLPAGGILIRFRDQTERDKGLALLEKETSEIILTESAPDQLNVTLTEEAIQSSRHFALQQNMTILRKRVNELGVAEPVVQQQGQERIVVQLPGVQDTAKAKEILGAIATLEFLIGDDKNNVQDVQEGRAPPGSKLYKERSGRSLLLKKQVMLTGEHIIDAASGIAADTGLPEVNITLDSKGARIFSRVTRDRVGKQMAVVYIENKPETVERDGEKIKTNVKTEEVISYATIQGQLSKRFRITGLSSTDEARNLALLLRAGALATPIEIIEERTVGPSLGKNNIRRGFNSVMIGFIGVLLFMLFYYRVFGLFANIALGLNLVLIIAMLSLLQATLTLPGIAGIVLTVGMAVDANVLIFERIREELHNGNSAHASIYAGYQKAFSTIADANITTLIAALVLFSFGTGPIKGFAVTLSLGIISSMFTAIVVTRALVSLVYGHRQNLKRLYI